MATSYVLTCPGEDGQFIANTAGSLGGNDSRLVPHCPSGGLWQTIEYEPAATAVDLELLGITPESVLVAFTFGFGAVALFWSLGFAVSAARESIRGA